MILLQVCCNIQRITEGRSKPCLKLFVFQYKVLVVFHEHQWKSHMAPRLHILRFSYRPWSLQENIYRHLVDLCITNIHVSLLIILTINAQNPFPLQDPHHEFECPFAGSIFIDRCNDVCNSSLPFSRDCNSRQFSKFRNHTLQAKPSMRFKF